ncbi:hypothetical protein [Dickeya dianthicola]|uniref:hypothetical protein n=1 Tax=Dickeya dianthicola TaxID=204039 RepID=UPI0003A8A33F|nr:hypothetical protein [Dickeya dianthicola]MCI4032526.1 hypothetical protein [Dickeya dianthicola]MCI4172153.1 hypothetical protein [Dickeya dianthicola]MCI4175806.1 hypothetical protein [Dickeya dianthicola]MCI4182369.1 hypothetical protein [Dickeya dianthicola]MCI4195898.1 hypothetical protein [Dickeya dianthicola]
MADYEQTLRQIIPVLTGIRRHIHQHPEIGFEAFYDCTDALIPVGVRYWVELVRQERPIAGGIA